MELEVGVGREGSRRRERGGRSLEGEDRSWSWRRRCKMEKGSRRVVVAVVDFGYWLEVVEEEEAVDGGEGLTER